MITPSFLTSGSRIALVAPARKVTKDDISFAVKLIKDRGFIPVFDERLFLSHNQLAGDDEQRCNILQHYLDADDVDAIMCVRGGYGTIRIIDRLNFDKFLQRPKWIAGYSDVTVLHSKLSSLGVKSLHATMPINFHDNTPQALDSTFDALTGKVLEYEFAYSPYNISGKATGEVVGGNISVLYSLLGSDIFPDTNDKILFLEDLDEYLYHIDRMMTAFQRAGILDKIKGLIVGGLTKMHDNTIPFGMTAEDIILEKVEGKNIPVCFDFPAGHIPDNRAVVMSGNIEVEVGTSGSLCRIV